MLIIAGFLFVTSAGNPQQVAQAKSLILWVVIGLTVILLSKGLVTIITGILGAS